MVMVNVNEILEGHVALDIQCLDRIYLNSYVPTLQVGGQVVSFMAKHLGYRIPSPAILEKIGTAFRRSVNTFAETNHVPLIRFAKEDRKIDVMRRYLAAQEKVGRSGVVAVGVVQEYQNVFASAERQGTNGIRARPLPLRGTLLHRLPPPHHPRVRRPPLHHQKTPHHPKSSRGSLSLYKVLKNLQEHLIRLFSRCPHCQHAPPT